ncbi:hypothetical protein AVEN_159470-1 [Araneus ventricosus]|uniref:Uncharacterized protein n=1 Tax=Araneus ventricosus TaxID=182803 RepID=A0A4Y2A147_ARAVE|nr:hypothetical protein AVEN_159470-1 [Araneus ventricosus]
MHNYPLSSAQSSEQVDGQDYGVRMQHSHTLMSPQYHMARPPTRNYIKSELADPNELSLRTVICDVVSFATVAWCLEHWNITYLIFLIVN